MSNNASQKPKQFAVGNPPFAKSAKDGPPGRLLGRVVAFKAWQKAQSYFDGSAAGDAIGNAMATGAHAIGNPQAVPTHPAN